jgi:hypothetical protein
MSVRQKLAMGADFTMLLLRSMQVQSRAAERHWRTPIAS